MNTFPAFGSDGQRKDFSRVLVCVLLNGCEGQLTGSKAKLRASARSPRSSWGELGQAFGVLRHRRRDRSSEECARLVDLVLGFFQEQRL
jgi:hypothetical protein